LVKGGFEILKETSGQLPRNIKVGESDQLMIRKLDCAVIETLHKVRRDLDLRDFDSVRGVFWEGDDLYPNAGFREKDHIQLCIRNPNCVKGFFFPREADDSYYKF